MTRPRTFGLLLYPGLTQLDLTGPYEVFARVPQAQVQLIWKQLDPVVFDRGLALLPTTTFAQCPALDLICVPGGPGQVALMDDAETLAFLRQATAHTERITSVCTGALVLGAAGLLTGYRATTHWAALEQLALLGAYPQQARVVHDRDRITGAGVTSGIDFALHVVADLYGAELAQRIQLQLEYDPQPPYAGSPRSAEAAVLDAVREHIKEFSAVRLKSTQRAAARLVAQSD